jgi:hypothetical protein
MAFRITSFRKLLLIPVAATVFLTGCDMTGSSVTSEPGTVSKMYQDAKAPSDLPPRMFISVRMPSIACRDPDFYEYSQVDPPEGTDPDEGRVRPVKRKFEPSSDKKFFTMDDEINSSVRTVQKGDDLFERYPEWFPEQYREDVPRRHHRFGEFDVGVAIGFLENEESSDDSDDRPNYIEEYQEDLPKSIRINLRAEDDVFQGTSVYFGGGEAGGGGETGKATFQPDYSGSEKPSVTFPAYLSYSSPEPSSLGPQMGKVELTFTMPRDSDFLPALRKLARAEENDLKYAGSQRSFQISSTNPYAVNQTLNEAFNEALQRGVDDVVGASLATLVILTGGSAAPLLIGGGTAASVLGGFYFATEFGLWGASLLSERVKSGGVTDLADVVLGSGTNVITGNPEGADLQGCEINDEGVIPKPDRPQDVGTGIDGAIAAKSGPFVTAGDVSRRLQYTDIAVAGVAHGEAAWGRADSDARSEFVLSGDAVRGTDFDPLTQIYSVQNGQLSSLDTDIVNVGFSSVDWGNASASGEPQDLVVSGFRRGGFEPVTMLYRNRGGTFEPAGAGLVDVGQGDVEWVDYDQDGDDDLLVTGYREKSIDPANPATQLYQNTDTGFEPVIDTSLPDVGQSEAAWADFDADQDMDLALSGRGEDGRPVTRLYRNTANGFEVVEAGLPNLVYTSLAWGDYDNDSDPDLAVSGENEDGQSVLNLYENEGGSFTLAMEQPTGRAKGDVVWKDFNQDGFPDLVVMGENGVSGQTAMFVIRNARGDQFGEARRFSGARYGTVSWGDFDGDGDPDLLQVGERSGGTRYGRILENR